MSALKRFGEKFKQTVGLTGGDKDWKPTSNARNMVMLTDIRRFAQELKAVLAEVKKSQTQLEGTLAIYKGVLLAPLPKAHDETPTGVVPVDKEDHAIGLNAMPDGLTAAVSEMSTALNTRVITPLEEWLNEYRKTKKMNEKVEQLRLDLDTQRRDTACLQQTLVKQQAVNHKSTELTKHKALTETDKLNRLAERYADEEAAVYASFLRLVRDSAVLRDIMAESIAIIQRSLTTAFTSFNVGVPTSMPQIPEATKMPMITYPGGSSDAGATSTATPSVVGGMSPEQAAALSAGVYPDPVKPDHAAVSPEAGAGGAMFGRAPSPNGDAAPPPYPAYPPLHSGDSGVPPPAWQPLPEPVKPVYEPTVGTEAPHYDEHAAGAAPAMDGRPV